MTRFHMYAQASKHPHEADDIFVEKPNSGEQVIRANIHRRVFKKILFLRFQIFFAKLARSYFSTILLNFS